MSHEHRQPSPCFLIPPSAIRPGTRINSRVPGSFFLLGVKLGVKIEESKYE